MAVEQANGDPGKLRPTIEEDDSYLESYISTIGVDFCSGEISYNGFELDEFVPWKTSAYINQYDLHIPEITVRETLDFLARCQGIGTRAELLIEVSRREKEAGLIPDPDIDTYMKRSRWYRYHQARATVEQVKQIKAVKKLSVTEAFKAAKQSSNNPLGDRPQNNYME